VLACMRACMRACMHAIARSCRCTFTSLAVPLSVHVYFWAATR
jgi:hypothetical protein